MNDVFLLFKPIAGIYLLVMAIRGKGQLFDAKYLKCTREKFVLQMRLLCLLSALLMFLGGANDIFAFVDPQSVLGWVIWSIGIISLIGIIVYSVMMTDRQAMREAEARGEDTGRTKKPSKPAAEKMPRDAFEFDQKDDSADAQNETPDER